jgi:hypothetical protein
MRQVSRSREMASLESVQTSEMRSAVCRSSMTIARARSCAYAAPLWLYLPASNLLRCRQYSGFFLQRIRHDFVRFQVPGSHQILSGAENDPFVLDAIAEEGTEGLQFDAPSHRADVAVR